MPDSLLSVENLRIAYPQKQKRATSRRNLAIDALSPSATIWAVDDVSFDLQPGERLGLVGESGCGKSTLGRAVLRLLPSATQIEGHLRFDGRSLFDLSPEALRRFRGEAVSLVFQDPMTRLDPLMTIGEHCIETLRAHQPHLSRRQARVKALEVLETVKIPANRWAQYPHEFSGGMRQRVAIALALLLNPRLIVADEPTTSLDVTVSAQILQELTRLCADRQMALLLISHDLAMVGEYCDRLAVMYGGKMVEMGDTQSIFQNPQHEYTRSLLKAALHVQNLEQGATGIRKQPSLNSHQASSHTEVPLAPSAPSTLAPSPLLRLQNLQQHYSLEQNFFARLFSNADATIRAVDGIDLELFSGETLGLVGESGCGKSTLSRTVLHLLRPTGGKVEFLQQDLTRLSRQQLQQQRRQMQMIFQDPHACLNPRMTVGDSIADPLLIHRLCSPAQAKEKVEEMLERVGLTPTQEFYPRYPGELSGGQQQRVAIARALITRPKLVICDEPVSMLDASIQSQVLDLMQSLKQEFDLTYLFITHDLWVARYFCDRIAVMNAGQIVELGETEAVFNHPQHPYTKTLLSAAPLLNGIHTHT
ncbi:MAG: ABC transporter ATP-binding protein [Scytolyngbya sp. HA4215-MV1]|jgi:peptide/nickel transport system ATP-binding protein|nr:ABC transporter ATP-binding protein [Scytolyngbya sp. HA4215-MV1]